MTNASSSHILLILIASYSHLYMSELLHKPTSQDLDVIASVNQTIATKAGAPEPSAYIGGEQFTDLPRQIVTPFAYDVARQMTTESYAARKISDPETIAFMMQLPDGSMVQLALPNVKTQTLTSVYGLKVPYASQPGQFAQDRVGLLVAADIRGFSREGKTTRFPTRIDQVYATQALPAFDPRHADNPDYRDMVTRNAQLALAAGLNKVHAKFGMQKTESTSNNRHSPVDATHDSATFQLLSLAARQQVSNNPGKLVHLNHFTGGEGTNIFELLQQEFAQSSPTVDEMNRTDQFTYPFPLRLLELPLSGLPNGLPAELQFTEYVVMAEQNGLYPLDLSPVAAVQDVRARGLSALGDPNLVRDPMSGLDKATGGREFLSLL